MIRISKPSKAQKFIEDLAITKICQTIRAGEFEVAEKYLLEKDYDTDRIALEVMASGDPITYAWYASTRLEVGRWTEIVEAVVSGNTDYLRVILAPSGTGDWSVALCAATILDNREIISLVLENGPAPYLPRNVSGTHTLVGPGGFLEADEELAGGFSMSHVWPVSFTTGSPWCYVPASHSKKVLNYLRKNHPGVLAEKSSMTQVD